MVHFAAVAAFTTLRYLRRECPVCGNVQVEAVSRIKEAVACDTCGYRIPPPSKVAA